ncbi:aldo/keto reductase [Gynuella sunshinyii]|uniref:Putative oxidoreductase (Related to aryl-alcohol dehydrogenase) n=1 Tax=Gynuella sunshinyii YC6258 TaxID=1445510 RepID=A0A0C5W0V6_9GAMM|nr:aldo/keto reductase [Gynuella sunshinyii]AJQ96309.1 putative oxidoreductase (related to aryl-alcohol dehydrogenase) [Gynuella sunshinyii YC6258]
MQMTRRMGDWDVSALGLGCWAIGGPFWAGTEPKGWGDVDDDESIRAIHAGLEAGINFFDTADVYGAGHSERLLGKAIAQHRSKIIIASKFGNTFDEPSRQMLGQNAEPAYIENAVEASLKRLNTDYIDLLWFHLNDYPAEQAYQVAEALESLVTKGKILKFGWSTDFPARAEVFAGFPNCIGYEFEFNVLTPSSMMSFCEQKQLAAVIRGPLAMGLLSGKYDDTSQISVKDVRSVNPDWMGYFRDGKPKPELLQKFDALRSILTSHNRTPVQGALAWLWKRSELTIPIPGFRSVQQVNELAGAMEAGPLTDDQMTAVDEILAD